MLGHGCGMYIFTLGFVISVFYTMLCVGRISYIVLCNKHVMLLVGFVYLFVIYNIVNVNVVLHSTVCTL